MSSIIFGPSLAQNQILILENLHVYDVEILSGTLGSLLMLTLKYSFQATLEKGCYQLL